LLFKVPMDSITGMYVCMELVVRIARVPRNSDHLPKGPLF